MRTKNSLINTIVSLSGYSLFILVSFISRHFFVKYLSAEYLGIDGLFGNIISVLSLAELGIGTAVTFSLYEPIENSNIEKIKSLMNFYKKVYRVISLVVLIIGLLLMPILQDIIKTDNNLNLLYIYFFVFVLNSSISYLMSYKRLIIIADQKNYLVSLNHYLLFIILNIFQILFLILFQKYLLFLLLKLVFTILENYIISKKADMLYPFIKDKDVEKLNKLELESIISNVKALFIQKIGVKLVLSTDSIIISTIVGIYWVGIYSNYYLITGTLHGLSEQVLSAITASVGNLNINEKTEKKYQVFNNLFFLNFIAFFYMSTILLVTINDFIVIWLGQEYVLSFSIVIVLIINFYVTGMRKVNMLFRNAFGLFMPLRYMVFVEVIINIVLSILLGVRFRILGVLIATLISTILVPFWVEPYIVFSHSFKGKLNNYFMKYFKYLILLFISFIFSMMAINNITEITILNLVLKLLIGFIINTLLIVLFFYKTDEFQFFIKVLIKQLKK